MGNTAIKNNNIKRNLQNLQNTSNLTDEQQVTANTTTATTTAATATTTITTVGDQQNNIFKNQPNQQINVKKVVDIYNQTQQQQHQLQRTANLFATKTPAAEHTAALKQRSSSVKATIEKQSQKQHSTWSLASLSARHFNWSFSGSSHAAARHSFRQRNKSTRKSLTSVQQLRRSKTTWHKPITYAIFNSHFKESTTTHANHLKSLHIEQLVAKGAFGIVFKVTAAADGATNVQTQAKTTKTTTASSSFYALKVLKKSKILAENSVQQIKDEADIQKLCGHHPFIVQQIDLWQNRHNLHILSEYVPNGELFSKIANFSLDLIRLYLAEIALAIDFLHNAGIIYRDAKPENILLTQDFHIKLTDFGLSKWLKLGMTTRTMCGTFQYMAPEILRGEAYGHAVDWWSLGIIACQMAIQKCPDFRQFLQLNFEATTPKSSIKTQVAAGASGDSVDRARVEDINEISSYKESSEELSQAEFLPTEVEALPHAAKDVIKRLLVIEPKQRLRSVLALQRIALYKNFAIDPKHLLSLSPLEIIAKDGIQLNESSACVEVDSALAAKAFQDF